MNEIPVINDDILNANADTKIKFPIPPKICFVSGEELYDFFISNKLKIEEYIINTIKYGIKHNLNELTFFDFCIAGNLIDVVSVKLNRTEWINYLETIIKKYELVEEFEKCTEFKQLLTILKNESNL